MATNNLAPTGFSFARNYISGANTYGQTQATILNGYTAAIMMGDPVLINANGTVNLVASGTGTNVGFLGIFGGVLPYYDTTLQATAHGLNGAYMTTAAPPSGINIPCTIITDPYATFIVQSNATTGFQQSWVGKNCNWLFSSLGNVGQGSNAAGRSAGLIDIAGQTPTTTNTWPFRIVGPYGVSGGPQDPANANPWLEVIMNGNFAVQTTGI